MRGLVLALILANIAYFAYMSQQSGGSESSHEEVSAGLPSIRLLNEVEQAAVVEEAGGAPEPSAQAAEPVVEEADAPIGVTGQTADACYTLGPFREVPKLREVIRSLKGSVKEASFRSKDEKEQSVYWVYLAPGDGLEAAKKMTRSLRAKGIKDSYIILEGPNQHGISLGHFREKARSAKLAARISALGFDPVIEPVFRYYTIYWLDFRVSGADDIDSLLAPIQLDRSISRFDRSCV